MYRIRFVSLSVTTILASTLLLGANVALAQGSGMPSRPPFPDQQKPRPLQILHEQRIDIQQGAKAQWQDMQREKKEIRADMKAGFKAATSGPAKKDVLQQGFKELKELRGEQKELRGTTKERLQALHRTHLGFALGRLNNATNHFETLVTRLTSRIEKLKERGLDTARAESALATAVALIETAKADVSAVSSLVSSVQDSDDTESAKTEIRTAMTKAMESIKAAHEALRDVVRILVSLIPPPPSAINSEPSAGAQNTAVE